MKKIILTVALLLSSSLSLEAHENIPHDSEFYLVTKALVSLGNTVDEDTKTVDGDKGYGIGIDLGYELGHGFSVEYDFTYSNSSVVETDAGTSESLDATYYTHSIDIGYLHHLSKIVGVYAKAGYEYEIETINSITSSDTGFVFAGGVELAINKHYTTVFEYEKSTIESPRGDSIFTGVMYKF
jgi:opacity protein-like surface antigen